MKHSAATMNLTNEKKAKKLSDAIKRLASDVEFLVSKWDGDAK